jgi:hypothetical protein
MSIKYLNNLKQELSKWEQEIKCISIILITAEEQASLIQGHSRTSSVLREVKSHLEQSIKYRDQTKLKIEEYENMKEKPKVQVMYFMAGHHQFDQDEIMKMVNDLKKFSEDFFVKNINSGSSDVGMLYVSNDVSIEEAQQIWNYIMRFQYHGNDTVFEYGDLLYWNGKEVTKN